MEMMMQQVRITIRGGLCAVWPVSALIAGMVVAGGCTNNAVPAIQADNARVAFQSQCAQNVITCTSSFPTAVISVQARHGQQVERTGNRITVWQSGHGAVWVQLRGRDSDAGSVSTAVDFSWSARATDDDPCSMAAGDVFSTLADPLVLLEPGFHYIRLTVSNDVILSRVESDECGLIGENVPAFDFLEVEIEVRRG